MAMTSIVDTAALRAWAAEIPAWGRSGLAETEFAMAKSSAEALAMDLKRAADEVERRRASDALVDELVGALERLAHEHLQFASYFEDDDHAVQMEARALLAKVKESGSLRIAQSDNRDRSST